MVKKSLAELFQAMYHGKYDFRDFAGGPLESRYRPHPIAGGAEAKDRLVYAPDKTLKVYHSFLNLFLFEYLDVNENIVFSYRKGVNVVSAVRRHSANRHFFQSDIRDFFPNIDSAMIRRAIERAEFRTPISDLAVYLDRVLDLVTVNGSLPIGFPASPLISNAVLRPFDDAFETYCNQHDLVYTRYSDDIIVSSLAREKLADLSPVIEGFLRSADLENLKLNPEKTKITSVGRKIKLLGLVILPNGSVSIDRKLKLQIETMLYFYSTDTSKLRDFTEADLTKSVEQISGYINYVNTVDPIYLDKLRKKYGVTVIDTLMHQASK